MGRKLQPGLRDLPAWLRENFRNLFIRRIIEQICSNDTPWHNPSLSSLQHDFDRIYPGQHVRLHSDDAAVVPVRSPTTTLITIVAYGYTDNS